jgi:hypothetical protein
MPCVYVYNKIDQISLEEVDRYLPRIVHALQFVLLIFLAFMKIFRLAFTGRNMLMPL